MPLKINDKILPESDIHDEMSKMRLKHQELYPDIADIEREKLLFDWAIENLQEREILLNYAEKNIVLTPEEIENIEEKSDAKIISAKLSKLILSMRQNVETISDKELKKYYKNHINNYRSPEQIHVKHIVKDPQIDSDALKVMQEIKVRLDGKEDFDVVGKQYSDCGGMDLGFFSRGQMVQSFEELVFQLKVGEISGIFETEFGYHIASVIAKRPGITAKFEQVKSHIQNILLTEKAELEVQRLVDKLKSDFHSEYIVPEKLVESAQRGFLFPKNLNFILVKPAGPDCNLHCDYCFYLEKESLFSANKHRMTNEILENLIQQSASQSEGRFNFGWQGGEPTLMGLDFFRKVVEIQQKFGGKNKFGNSIQTNGMLLNETWADFFREQQFLVGLSIDGPEYIHNRYRMNAEQIGSWQKVDKAARILLDKKVMVNALSTVNNYSADYPDEIYHYLKKQGFQYMQFIPIVETDNEGELLPFSVNPQKYGEFLCRIFDLWTADFVDGVATTSIRMFDSVLHSYVGLQTPECTMREECGNYLVVEHNGDIYSCDFFVEKKWKLGNIFYDYLLESLNSNQQLEFGKIKKDIHFSCQNCQWLNHCHGGCPKNRSHNNDNFLCDAYKIFFQHADDKLKAIAKDIMKTNQ